VRVLILGAGGQVGRALVAALPDATALGRDEFDIASAAGGDPACATGRSVAATADGAVTVDWSTYDTVINAAAFTDVDGAETAEGRVAAWRANAAGPAALAVIARRHDLTLVHLSSEYVFDGALDRPYREDDAVAPLSAYGASKAAGDLAVQGVDRHYLLRPTWVVGEGRNFVATMLGLAARGIEPAVVDDQIGRPTFAVDLAAAIEHLLLTDAPHGTYHVTGGGEPASWAEVARAVYEASGHGDLTITGTTTAAYFADKPGSARRPLNSVLDTTKAEKAGVAQPDWREQLAAYVAAAP
jgi:dTDP-4-dehydrorhamnose reductase